LIVTDRVEQLRCCLLFRATGLLDGMPVFVDQSGDGAGHAGTGLPGEDTASQNVLIERIFGGKKLVSSNVSLQ